jgi:hypothetical protein
MGWEAGLMENPIPLETLFVCFQGLNLLKKTTDLDDVEIVGKAATSPSTTPFMVIDPTNVLDTQLELLRSSVIKEVITGVLASLNAKDTNTPLISIAPEVEVSDAGSKPSKVKGSGSYHMVPPPLKYALPSISMPRIIHQHNPCDFFLKLDLSNFIPKTKLVLNEQPHSETQGTYRSCSKEHSG